MDLVRRRRWHRKLIQQSDVADAPVFKMDVGEVSVLSFIVFIANYNFGCSMKLNIRYWSI